ncbi:MAG: glycosyltransferase family 39 protein [Thermoleophilaceae bacterium]
MIRRLRQTPAPLALLLAVAAVTACAWIVVLPPLQGPDEVSHFSYTQRMVEGGTIPWEPRGGNAPGYPYSREVGAVEVDAGFGPLAANVAARPYWTPADKRFYSAADAKLGPGARTGGGETSSLKNPPLYYMYAAVPYVIARGGSYFDREMLMRLANVPLLLIAVIFVWLVIGELLGRGWPQVVGTAAAALLPQLLNVAATVNPDLLLVAEWSAALYLMLLVLRRGPRRPLVAGVGALCVAGALTHARSLPLFAPAALAVGIAVARERGWRVRPAAAAATAFAAYSVVVLTVAAWGHGSIRQFLSYVWQFYLPRLSFMTPKPGAGDYGFRLGYVDRLYGTIAQLEVILPHGLEEAMWWISLGGLVALVVALIVRRRGLRAQAAEAWVLGFALLALLIGLHLAAYRSLIANPLDPIVTARYLLPLLPLFGVAVALIASTLPRRAAPVFAGLVVAAGLALQLESIGLLVERFYA